VPLAAPARFHSLSGLLTAVRKGNAIELDFPATPDEPEAMPAGLAEALGAPPTYFGRSRFDCRLNWSPTRPRIVAGWSG
jgi:hypothetical protein